MKTDKSVRILGFGKYLPQAVTSAELEKKHGLPAGWAEKYSGVRSRHHVSFESNGYMGARAIEQALENSGVQLGEIDLILSAAASYDYPIPNSASVIKSELKNAERFTMPAIDINSTCLSFVSAFEMASHLLDGKQYRKILIVSSEIASFGLNPANAEVFTLFGDGAVAVVLAYDPGSESGFIKAAQRNYSEGVYDTLIEGGGTRHWKKSYDPKLHSFAMKGKNLLRLARRKVPEFVDAFFSDLPLDIQDVDSIIPHQASKTGISLFKTLFPLKEGQVKENLATHGNCIAASIPLVLFDAVEKGEIKRGDTCLLIGTSAGFSIGALLFKY